MKIMIEIPEEEYKKISNSNPSYADDFSIYYAIKNGTPLPKGHGDLKDELDLDLFAPSLGISEYVNDLMAKHNIDYVNGDDEDKVRAFASDLIHSCMNVIKTAPTIIEADKEE